LSQERLGLDDVLSNQCGFKFQNKACQRERQQEGVSDCDYDAGAAVTLFLGYMTK